MRASQGKSYILNQLLGQSSGFVVAPTHRPCTKVRRAEHAEHCKAPRCRPVPARRVVPAGDPLTSFLSRDNSRWRSFTVCCAPRASGCGRPRSSASPPTAPSTTWCAPQPRLHVPADATPGCHSWCGQAEHRARVSGTQRGRASRSRSGDCAACAAAATGAARPAGSRGLPSLDGGQR